MKSIFTFLLAIAFFYSYAQHDKGSMPMDSIAKAKAKAAEDSMFKVIAAKVTYPLIKGSTPFMGVIPVKDIDEKTNTNQQYKLLFEISEGFRDSAGATKLNEILVECARQVNLHVAAGIPLKNLDIVVVSHGAVLKSFYNDAVYNKKYHVNNPNDTLLNDLKNAGLKFIVCGQAMNFLGIEKAEIFPWIKVALSAQTVITDYETRGYILRELSSK